MRVTDSGAAREGQRVAFLVACPRFDDDIVLLGGILLLDNLVVQFAEAALVCESPGLAALALEEHQLSVVEGRYAKLDYLAVFGSVDRPALFHLGGIIETGVVTGSAVFSETRSQIGVAFKRTVGRLFRLKDRLGLHSVGIVNAIVLLRNGFVAEVGRRDLSAGFCLDAVLIGESVHHFRIAFFCVCGREQREASDDAENCFFVRNFGKLIPNRIHGIKDTKFLQVCLRWFSSQPGED